MGAFKKIGFGLVVVAALGWAWIEWSFPRCSFNYKLTASAETPQGTKNGSSVIQVSYGSRWGMPGERRGDFTHKGEALYLDLGAGKNLFITLEKTLSGRDCMAPDVKSCAQDVEWLPVRIWNLDWDWGEERELCAAIDKLQANSGRDVPLVMLPTTVTFKDMNEPRSIALVDPRNIAAVLGEGYALSGARIELTSLGPARAIDKALPWLRNRSRLSGGSAPISSNQLTDNLGSSSFSWWGDQ